jgi:hypothetical protein
MPGRKPKPKKRIARKPREEIDYDPEITDQWNARGVAWDFGGAEQEEEPG